MKQKKAMRSTVLLGSVITAIMTGLASAGESFPPPPVTSEPASTWNWFIGASGGVAGDDADAFWSAHVGMETIRGRNSHAIFLDVGFTEFELDDHYSGGGIVLPGPPGGPPVAILDGDPLTADLDIMPVTLNYKYEYAITENFGWYIGAGAGVAFVDTDLNLTDDDDVDLGDGNEEVFYAQIFTGLTWNVTENFEVFGGARYYYMDTIDIGDDDISISDSHDDWIVELGLRFNF